MREEDYFKDLEFNLDAFFYKDDKRFLRDAVETVDNLIEKNVSNKIEEGNKINIFLSDYLFELCQKVRFSPIEIPKYEVRLRIISRFVDYVTRQTGCYVGYSENAKSAVNRLFKK